jgi:hypothetical protein
MGYLPDWLINFVTGKHPYAALIALSALCLGTLTQIEQVSSDVIFWIFIWTLFAIVFVFFVAQWTEHNS